MVELMAHSPDILLLTEVWTGPRRALPSWPGFTAFEARGPRAGHDGVAAYVANRLTAVVWRSRPADGVLWLRLSGVLPGGRSLFLAVCYFPPLTPGMEAREADAALFQRLAADWVAASRQGTPVLSGDFNARTKSGKDWPG